MADFRIALGGSLSVVTPDELNDSIAGLQGHIDKRLGGLTSRNADTPIRRNTSGSYSGALTNGVPTLLQFGISRPGMGRTWALTRLTICGGDDHTTVANLTAALYIGDAATPMLGDLVIPAMTLPYFNTFNTKTVWVDDSQELYLMLNPSAGIASQTIVATASVSEFWSSTVDQQHA